MSEQPWGGQLPPEIKDTIDELFPKSEAQCKIAYTLMFYNHKPSVAEMQQMASAVERSVRTVQAVVRRLCDNSLFTTELGSVPLYKHIGTMGASKMLEGWDGDDEAEDTDTQLMQPSFQPNNSINEAHGETVDAEY